MQSFGVDSIDLKPGTSAFLMGAYIKQTKYKTLEAQWSVDDSLDELERLSETAGLEVRGRDFQTMQHPTAKTFIGSGKVEELAAAVKALRVEAVVFDEELSPAQGRNLQVALGGVIVIDRTTLILQIFAQRARTSEAKLQVQAARMKYMLPRLQTLSGFLTTGAGMDTKGGSSGGGGFLKGSGETQIESDKRLFRIACSPRTRAAAAKGGEKDGRSARGTPSCGCLNSPRARQAALQHRERHRRGGEGAGALPCETEAARRPARRGDRWLHERGQVVAA